MFDDLFSHRNAKSRQALQPLKYIYNIKNTIKDHRCWSCMSEKWLVTGITLGIGLLIDWHIPMFRYVHVIFPYIQGLNDFATSGV